MRQLGCAVFGAVIAVQIALAGCSDGEVLGIDGLIGEYQLVTVSGEQLPAPGLVNAVYQAGLLVLRDDHTFAVTLDTVVLGRDVQRIVAGTFAATGSNIQFTVTSVTQDGQSSAEEGVLPGTWNGGAITIVEGDLEFLFEREGAPNKGI